jgi:hypothetical protein
MERRLVHDDEPQDAERLFLSSIRSEVTKRAYIIYLKKFVEIIKCRNINDLLTLGETKDIENKINSRGDKRHREQNNQLHNWNEGTRQ